MNDLPIWNNSLTGLAIMRSDGSFYKVNRILCDILEFNEEELLSKTFSEVSHDADIRMDLRLFRQVVQGKKQGYDIRKRFISKTGRVFWSLLRVTSYQDDLYVAQILPITEKKTPEKGLLFKFRLYWPIILTGLTALGYLVAEFFRTFLGTK